ncbi:hypothetical protein EXS71_00350 [Candidatus Uhrbacteria bacterium]|nr:hypothetical protein [Candidatus Uhrbacteria bacterium]
MSPQGRRRPHVVPITAPSFPMLPRPRVYKTIAYSFIALVVVVVIGVLWLSSVRADITVHAKKESARFDGTVAVAKSPDQGQIAGRVVQGVFEKIQEFRVEELVASSTAAAATVPAPVVTSPPVESSVLAKGTVRIINKYSKAQTLVKKTRLLTSDQKLYRIGETVVIESGKEVSVVAYADQAGSQYAIGPTKFTIPGLFVDLQQYIYAVSDSGFVTIPLPKIHPATGLPTSEAASTPSAPAVTKKSGKTITQAEVDEAQRRLMDAVFEQAKKSLAVELTDSKFGEVVYLVKPLEKKTNASAGQSAETFLASVKLDVTAVYYPKDDMLAFIRSKLKEKIPEGRELMPFDQTIVSYRVQSADAKGETAVIQAGVDGGYRLTPTSPLLDKSLVAGKSEAEAVNALRSISGVENVTIIMHPRWFGKLPSLKDHIEIKVE